MTAIKVLGLILFFSILFMFVASYYWGSTKTTLFWGVLLIIQTIAVTGLSR